MNEPESSPTPADPISPVPAPAERGRGPGPGLSLLLYFGLTVLFTWPLAAHLGDGLPAGDSDLWQNYWNYWWWETALLERGQSPYHTDLLYQPGEVSLAFHTHAEADILIALPVQLAAGVPAALNISVLLGYVLAGWGAYFLVMELARSRRAAFLAGVVFAFFPQHLEQSLEHINLASYQAMPFFLLFLLRSMRRGGVGNAVLCGAFFALDCLYSWHNGLLILPLALVLFLRDLLRPRRPRRLIVGDAILAGGVATLLVLPFLWPMLREMLAGETYYLKPPVDKGLDPVFLVLPPPGHVIWGRLVDGLYERWRTYAAVGFIGYVGLVPLAIWVSGWCRERSLRGRGADSTAAPAGPEGKRASSWGFWTCVFLVFVVLALGHPLTVAGTPTGVPLPFAAVGEIPLFKTLRVANRFLVPAMLALSVLVGFGARSLLAGRTPAVGRRLSSGLLLLIVLDFLCLPYPVRPVPQPEWVHAVESCPQGAVLDVPGGHRGRQAEDMFTQTLHGRPTIGGYTSCLPPFMMERVARYPFLQLAFLGRPPLDVTRRAYDSDTLDGDIRRVLEELPVGVVVLHRDRERERLARLQEESRDGPLRRLYNPEKGMPAEILTRVEDALRRVCGRPVYDNGTVALFEGREWLRAR